MDSVVPQLLLQVILIAINAFFAATEIAVISLNPNKLRKLVDEKSKTAAKLLQMVEEPAGFLSTIQVGITLAGFLASAFAAENFSDPLVDWIVNDLGFTLLSRAAVDTIIVVLITIVLSYFMLIFGELVPKRVAMLKSMQVAKMACSVISVLAVVMRPVVWLLSVSTNGVLRLFGLKTAAQEESVTKEEIQMMVDEGEEKGTIDPEEKELIQNIFDFDETPVREAMTHSVDVEAIQLEDSQEEILALIKSTGLSRFPVYGEDLDDIKGTLSTRTYLLNLQSEQPKPLEELLRPAYFVPESIHIDELFRDMQRNKLHFAVVVGEYGETSGIVTMEDLLEQLVGNIYDEFDPVEEKEIEALGDNSWRVLGSAPLDAITEETGVAFPEDLDFDTLGGLVMSTLRSIPEDGSVFDVEAYGLKIHVSKVEDRRVEEAFLQLAQPKEEPEEEERER